MTMRSLARRVIFNCGFLDFWHRIRNRSTLTVVLFHRVLEDSDPELRDADPEFAVKASLFRDTVSFLRARYRIVGLPELLACQRHGRALPDRALLITFDDGWSDTKRVALPVLRDLEVPAAVFLTTTAIASPDHVWWHDSLAAAARTGRLGDVEAEIARLQDEVPSRDELVKRSGRSYLEVLCQLHGLADEQRSKILSKRVSRQGSMSSRRQMLRPEEISEIDKSALAIGVHGASHLPLTALPPKILTRDIETSKELVAAWSQAAVEDRDLAFAFPHGRYDERTVGAVRKAGFGLMFTSDPCLNPMQQGARLPDLLGRINISSSAISDADGKLRPDRLASWVMLRPIKELDA